MTLSRWGSSSVITYSYSSEGEFPHNVFGLKCVVIVVNVNRCCSHFALSDQFVNRMRNELLLCALNALIPLPMIDNAGRLRLKEVSLFFYSDIRKGMGKRQFFKGSLNHFGEWWVTLVPWRGAKTGNPASKQSVFQLVVWRFVHYNMKEGSAGHF